MPRLLQSGIKMLAALIIFYSSATQRVPIILFACFGWCAWIWVKGRGRKSKVLSLAGFALMLLGWWGDFYLWSYFARNGEASHFSPERGYWWHLAVVTGQMDMALSVLAIVLLTWADYLIPAKPKPAQGLPTEVKPEQIGVWPPAPKQPPTG